MIPLARRMEFGQLHRRSVKVASLLEIKIIFPICELVLLNAQISISQL
jgi:hypothetical protein